MHEALESLESQYFTYENKLSKIFIRNNHESIIRKELSQHCITDNIGKLFYMFHVKVLHNFWIEIIYAVYDASDKTISSN